MYLHEVVNSRSQHRLRSVQMKMVRLSYNLNPVQNIHKYPLSKYNSYPIPYFDSFFQQSSMLYMLKHYSFLDYNRSHKYHLIHLNSNNDHSMKLHNFDKKQQPLLLLYILHKEKRAFYSEK